MNRGQTDIQNGGEYHLADAGSLSESLLVKAFLIEDSREEDWRPLQELLVPYRFREMSIADIAETADLITLYYRNIGFLIAQACVPKQDARTRPTAC